MRLMALAPGDKREAARRFLLAAPGLGVDPSHFWITTDERGVIRELCLGAKGSGRTVTLMLAPEVPGGSPGPGEDERAAVIQAAVAGLSLELGRQVGLFQALLSHTEVGAFEAFSRAGFALIGDLAYLRVLLAGRPAGPKVPESLLIRPLSELGPVSHWRAMLTELLDATYVDTLDCPGLCGLRETPDILDSHLAAGRWEPRFWWLVISGAKPVGCALVNPSIEGTAAELVYLGLAPEARGRGIGSVLLEHALAALPTRTVREVTCAVDRANTPALRLYARAGFTEFGARRALVRAPDRAT